MTFLNNNYLVIPWFIPFFFYESALFFMYNLSKLNKNKKFNKYTGWSRLQIFVCLPFLLLNGETQSIAADLIWTNSIGCYLTIHGFYLITKYELLIELVSKSLQKFQFYTNSFLLIYLLDFLVHGTPVIFSIFYLVKIKPSTCCLSPYIWLISGFPNYTYCFFLTGSWDPTPLYNCKKYPMNIIKLGWINSFFSYFIAYKLRFLLYYQT